MLKNIFSTILNLAPLQIRNSPPTAVQTAEFAVALLDKNCYQKNLHSLSEPYSQKQLGE